MLKITIKASLARKYSTFLFPRSLSCYHSTTESDKSSITRLYLFVKYVTMPLGMRIFIAFPVPEPIRIEAAKVAQLVRKKYPSLVAKWAPSGHMHVTLEFLGSITEKQVQVVRECVMYQTNKIPPFLYFAAGLAAFPNVHHPETIVITMGEFDTTYGMLLRKAVHEELSLYNLSRDFKLWRPHITLARVRNPEKVSVSDIASLPLPKMQWQVDRLELIESKLTSHGTDYHILETFFLG